MNLRLEGNIMNDLNNSQNLASRPRAASCLWLLSLMVCCAAAPFTTRAATLYVWQDSPSPVLPYTSWATAATNIQDAVGAAQAGDLVLVTNGTYVGDNGEDPYGDPTCVVVDNALTLQSINGPGVTIINGGGMARCVYLTNGAAMAGFTLTYGAVNYGAVLAGGGVYCEFSAVVSNCVLTGNSADLLGGGACGGTLNNCTLTGNLTQQFGGGAGSATLNNCILTGNQTRGVGGGPGAGAYNCTLNNCTLTTNEAEGGSSWDTVLGGEVAWSTLNNCIVIDTYYDYYAYNSVLNYCCISELVAGEGLFNSLNYCCTNDPAFGDGLHLQSNSPCINSGNNAYVVGATDLDGNPRIVGGTVDIGAYEYQTPTSIISYAWLQQYGLPTDGSVDHGDLDGTGMNVYQDWIAGLNPTNALSVLQMTSATPTNSQAGLVVTWESVSGIMYFLQSSTNLAAQPAFTTIQSNIVGQAGTTSYTDTNALGSGPFFYRVGVATAR
jgi:hypothetical protein